jgi:predicted nucleic acid-binding protein
MLPPLAYFDTSAIVKRYVDEPGSAQVRKLLWEHRLLLSAIGPLELVSAVCQRRAAGLMRPAVAERILADIRTDRAYWLLADVSEPALQLAEQLVHTSRLRSLDAIHVASAVIARSVSGEALPFITADTRQRSAAVTAGLDVVWVE